MKAFHLPIAAKAVLLIAALGLLSIAANALCLQRFHALEALNAQLTEHVAPARLALAEAKTGLETFGLDVYKAYAASDAGAAREAAEAIENDNAAVKNALNNVAGYDQARNRPQGRRRRQGRASRRRPRFGGTPHRPQIRSGA
jgi:hypothetical protein